MKASTYAAMRIRMKASTYAAMRIRAWTAVHVCGDAHHAWMPEHLDQNAGPQCTV